MSSVDNGSETPLRRIPDDWTLTTVGDEYYIQLGKMLDAEKNQGELKPYLGNKAVQWGQISVDDLPMMRMSKRDQERYRLNYGDILVCEGGDVGRAAIWNEPISGVFYQKALHRLRPKRDYNSHILISLLHWFSINGDFSDFVTQTSIAHLSKEKFATVPLPMPSADEQNAIASALKDIDDLIASLDALIAKKRDIKQAAMQQLLTGKKRLPGFKGEWEVAKLGEIAKIQRGASPRPIDSPRWFDDNSTIGWVRISDVTRSGMNLTETTQRLSAAGIQHSRFVTSGSLIMSICATIGRPIITSLNVCIHDGFVVFYDLKVEKDFLYFVLKNIEGEWSKMGQTGSQMNLNTGMINGKEISVPVDRAEQYAIAKIALDLENEIVVLQDKGRKARALKQGMMQQLLTGRIRLV